jgi:hypothetical protein
MHGADYDPVAQTLTLQFTNGAVYRSVKPVPATIADTLYQGSSPGGLGGTHYAPEGSDRRRLRNCPGVGWPNRAFYSILSLEMLESTKNIVTVLIVENH